MNKMNDFLYPVHSAAGKWWPGEKLLHGAPYILSKKTKMVTL